MAWKHLAWAAALWLGAGEAQAATFGYLFALDTSNGPLTGGVANSPVPGNGGESETFNFGSRIFTTTVMAGADRGVAAAMVRLSADYVFPGFSTARPEAIASTSGEVRVCGPGSSANACIPPSGPIPFPTPNVMLESVIINDPGIAPVAGYAHATGDVRINGMHVASVRHTATSSTPIRPSVPGDLTTGSFTMQIAVSTIANCATTQCLVLADASNSLKFVEGEPAFLGLPAGYTIFAPDFNIADNRWTDPRKPVGTPAPIPLPAGLPLLLSGLLALGVLRRRNRR
jgi:hypothetical protein